MVSLWHLPNMEIWKLDAYVYMRVIKCVSSGPPGCFGGVRLVLSRHDNIGDEGGILRIFTAEKVKDILNKIHTTPQIARWKKSGSEYRKSSEVCSGS